MTNKYRILFWFPIIAGFFTRLFIEVTDDLLSYHSFQEWHDFVVNQIGHSITHEINNMITAALYLTIPFIYCALSTQKDHSSKIPFNRALTRGLVRFIPPYALYCFLHYDIYRASILHLPGSSTAGIALMPFPVIGSIYIFIINVIIKEEPQTETE